MGRRDQEPAGAWGGRRSWPLHTHRSPLSSLRSCPQQNHVRSAVTDEHLRVRGTNDTIFALGAAATIEQAKASRAWRAALRCCC